VQQIHILLPEPGQLAEATAGIGRSEDQGPVTGIDCGGNRSNLFGRRNACLGGTLDAGALLDAGITEHKVVDDGR